MKRCSRCKIEKDESEFGKDSSRVDGLECRCKLCRKQYAKDNAHKYKQHKKQYQQNNAERICKYQKQYYEDNFSTISEYKQQYHKKNADKKRQYDKQYNQENADRIKASKSKWYRDNADAIIEQHKQYNKSRRANDASFKIQTILRSRLWHIIEQRDCYKNVSAILDLGCTIDELKLHIESQFEPGMTWDNWGKGEGCWHIDHIIPFHLLDMTQYSHQRLVCHYKNLRPMWAKDNLSRKYDDITNHPELIALAFEV